VSKDIEDLKSAGRFLLLMGLIIKEMAARLNESNLETDHLEQVSARDDIAIGDDKRGGTILQ